MKLFHQVAVCSLIVMATAWCGGADEQPKAPRPGPGSRPIMAMPVPAGTNMAGRMSPFSAEITADFMKKVMETSAKIEAIKERMAARKAKLYETDPEIKAARAEMIEKQKEINRILDADRELTELKMDRDLRWSTLPVLPAARERTAPARLPSTGAANR